MSGIGGGSKGQSKSDQLNTLILVGGKNCDIDDFLDTRKNADLRVGGGALIQKDLCLGGEMRAKGNICAKYLNAKKNVTAHSFIGNTLVANTIIETVNDKGISIIGNLILNDNLFLFGNVKSDFCVDGNLKVQNNTTLYGNTNIKNTLNVYGNTSFLSNVVANCNLDVGKNLTVIQDTNLGGNVVIIGDLTVTGNVFQSSNTMMSTINVPGDGSFGGNLNVTNDAQIGGNLLVCGNITTKQSISVNESITIGNTIITEKDGDINISGNLCASTLKTQGNIIIGNSIITEKDGDIVLIGNICANDVKAQGNIIIGNSTITEKNGNIIIGGDVIFTGNIIFEGDVVGGNISGGSSNVSATVENLCVTGNLFVGNIYGKSPINIHDELNITTSGNRITFENAVIIGTTSTTAAENNAVSIGSGSKSYYGSDIAIGNQAIADDIGIAIGLRARIGVGGNNYNSIAIGRDTRCYGRGCVSIGSNNGIGAATRTGMDYNVFIGYRTNIRNIGTVTAKYNVAVGPEAAAVIRAGMYNVFVGNRSGYDLADGDLNVFIGSESGGPSIGNNDFNTCVGAKARVGSLNGSTAVGYNSHASGESAIALGRNTVCSIEDGIALGNAASATTSTRSLALNVNSDSVNTSGAVPYLQCVVNGSNREIPLSVVSGFSPTYDIGRVQGQTNTGTAPGPNFGDGFSNTITITPSGGWIGSAILSPGPYWPITADGFYFYTVDFQINLTGGDTAGSNPARILGNWVNSGFPNNVQYFWAITTWFSSTGSTQLYGRLDGSFIRNGTNRFIGGRTAMYPSPTNNAVMTWTATITKVL